MLIFQNIFTINILKMIETMLKYPLEFFYKRFTFFVIILILCPPKGVLYIRNNKLLLIIQCIIEIINT